MSNHLDEDLIEATIRRVAEAKAAREAGGPAPEAAMTEPEQDAPAPDIDEDRIAETIRRVEAAKAAMMAAGKSPAEPQEEHGSETEPEADAAPVTGDEELLPHEAVRKSARRAAALLIEPTEAADEPHDVEPPAPAQAVVPNDAIVDALARIESGVQDSNAMMRAMIARIESLMPLLEKIGGAPPAPPPLFAVRSGTDASTEPSPRLTRSASPPPRPAVFRDLPSDPADDEDPAAAEIDQRPLPEPLPPIHAGEARRGLDLLPRGYRITVEDKRRGVDLVPLHRALLGMDGVRDMSLLSYNNGVAIVSLDTVNDLSPDDLEAAVSRAMARPAHVEVHNEHTMVVKLED